MLYEKHKVGMVDVCRMDCEAHDIQLLVISPFANVACGSQSTHL